MTLRIATYNVNSIRIRLASLKLLTDALKPDILCLQETKVEDQHFPAQDLKDMGYPYLAFSGQKSYNGVAIASRTPFTESHAMDVLDAGHKRHLSICLPGGVEVHNMYIPAGGDIPDRGLNDKFDFKLRFYDALTEWSAARKGRKMVMLGDFNVAPLPSDVWSHKQLLGVVSHTPVETDAMERLRASLDWLDTSRRFVPETEKLYSWWSYRNRDWEKSDRGRRLDHIWVTPELAAGVTSSVILKEARGWDNPSDHVPVLMEINT